MYRSSARFRYSRPCRSLALHRAALLIALITLAWSGPACCDAIHDAAMSGDVAKVKALLTTSPQLVSSRDAAGWTPLHVAAANGRTSVVKLLLASRADVNARMKNGTTPLHWAASGTSPHKDIVELLLARGADVNARAGNGLTPLHWASQGHGQGKEVVKLLLAHRANVNARDNKGRTPLQSAILWHSEEVAQLLRQHGGHE